jgi:hypothetical protein
MATALPLKRDPLDDNMAVENIIISVVEGLELQNECGSQRLLHLALRY